MTDEDDRRKKPEERRHPSEKDETAMPRRARDSGRVRQAIRTELEEVAEAGADSQSKAGIEPGRSVRRNVISLENISLSFEEPILQNVSFAAKEGETVVVVGESGTGKSTILKLLLRLLIPDDGRVAIDGEDITHLTFDDALKVRQKMGLVFQGAALFDSMTVYENVAYPLREHTELTEDEIEARVRDKLQFVDLEADKVMDQMPSELSGGMKKRVGIARGLANNPEIMLYDEPTSGLDPLTTATITYLILKLQRELGVTSVVVSHDIRSAFRMASKIALLSNKRIGFFGTPEEMTGSDDPYIREFLGGF